MEQKKEQKTITIFIGSSSNQKALDAMKNVALILERIQISGYLIRPVKWTDIEVFKGGNTTLQDLLNQVNTVNAAIFIYNEDGRYIEEDSKDTKPMTRSNVIFEHGLFTGSLSENQVIVITIGEMIKKNIQSDYSGYTYYEYDANKLNSLESKIQTWIRSTFVNELRSKATDSNVIPKCFDGDLIVESFSKNDNRDYEFSLLLAGAKRGDKISVMGMGVTSFLTNKERIEPLLAKGVYISILLMHESIIKNDWKCKTEQGEASRVLVPIHANKTDGCPVSVSNIIIDRKHFGQYQSKEKDEMERYLSDMKTANKLCKNYKKLYSDLFDYSYFYSFIPMSMTAINDKRMIVEYIIPFTKFRILIKVSKDSQPEKFNTFMFFFESIKKASRSTSKLKLVSNYNISNINKKQYYGKH